MVNRPKIAIVVPALNGGGGVPTAARFIARAISRSGEFDLRLISLASSAVDPVSVRLVQPRTWLKGVRTSQGTWEGFSYLHVGALGTELEFQRYRPRRVLTRELADADLIQVVCGGPSWALAVTGLDKPVVMAVASRTLAERRRREAVERGALASWRRCMTKITNRLDDRALRLADAVVVMNRWMLDYASHIATSRPAVRIEYGPPGVDTTEFCPLPSRLRNEETPAYILSVGRLEDPRKNMDLLLEAYSVMRTMTPTPPALKIAGPTDPGPAFWLRVRSLGLNEVVSVCIGETRAGLVELYRNALLFVLASDEEGFGIVVTESMACGVPVVATRCGGPDGIITDGIDGYLVARGDAFALADRMSYMVKERVANIRMGLEARRTAVNQFSEDAAGRVYLDTYRWLLQAKLSDS